MNEKIVMLQAIDATDEDIYQIIHGLGNLGRCMGYEFIITNVPITSISRDELLMAINVKKSKLEES